MRPRPLVLAVVALQVGLPLSMLIARWADEGTRAVTERPASWQQSVALVGQWWLDACELDDDDVAARTR